MSRFTCSIQRLSVLYTIASLYPNVASATNYNVRFCIEYSVDYTDASTSTGDDYFTDNADKTAYGARLRVTRNSDSYDIYYDYSDDSGVYAGCTTSLSLSSTESYSVKIYSEAIVQGNTLRVWNNDTAQSRYVYTLDSAYVPSASITEYLDTSLHDAWNISAAVGFAMYRRNGYMTGDTYTFYNQACGSGSCFDDTATPVAVYLDGGSRKYVIVHEMGHFLAYRANGNNGALSSYSSPCGICCNGDYTSHAFDEKEYQSAASNEGIAHYYAAVVFNLTTASDCYYYYYKDVDWDRDGDIDSQITNCEGGPVPSIDAKDYLGDMCSGTLTNRGTEYDWLRFFWDMETDEGLDYDDLLSMWNGANPDTWNATGDGTGANYPATRTRNSADALGFLTEWDNQDNDNGVHR